MTGRLLLAFVLVMAAVAIGGLAMTAHDFVAFLRGVLGY